ncbi:MAG: hypothetical protein JST62_10965, partial [Bacteroidetes bacterium]|nr:hypothetical protein [Bacteroidota bacterium]
MGNKLQKITEEKDITISHNGSSYTTNVVTTTDYSGVFVYESKSYSNQDLSDLSYSKKLQFFSHEEGRVRPMVGNTETPFVYDYFIKDHLG